MSLNTTARRGALVIPLFLLLAACASMPPPEKGVVEIEALEDEEGVVFGTLVTNFYNSKGGKITGKAVPEFDYTVYYGVADSISIKRAFAGFQDSISGSTKNAETFFAMRLPAGEYSMFKIQRDLAADKLPRKDLGIAQVDVRFAVAPKTATYIGALQIELRSTRGMLGDRIGEKVAFKVADETDKATKVYNERNPAAAHPIATDLMKVRRN